MKLICVGEALIDFTPYQNNESYIRNFGGAPANVAVIASRLGENVKFIGKIGADKFGAFILDILKEEKIEVNKDIVTEQANTTLAFVHLEKNGERSFEFIRKPGADMFLSVLDIENNFCEKGDIVHFGSAQLMIKKGREAIGKAIQIAHEKGALISFDPNYRAIQWGAEEEAKDTILSFLKEADIIKLSEEEAVWLTKDKDKKRAIQKIQTYTNGLVVITCGAEGAIYDNGYFSGYVRGFPQKAIDTTGAGDVFWGTFLALGMKTYQKTKKIRKEDIEEIIEYANAAGALSVQKKGAITTKLTFPIIHNYLIESKKGL